MVQSPKLAEPLADKPQEDCGVSAIYNHPNTSYVGVLSLHALQHRGQEAIGLCTSGKGDGFNCVKKPGIVSAAITQDDINSLVGIHAIGHVRYSTCSDKSEDSIQPFTVKTKCGLDIAMAHNGTLTNQEEIRTTLASYGYHPKSSSDSELILLMIQKEHEALTSGQKAHVQNSPASSEEGLEQNHATNASTITTLLEAIQNAVQQLKGAYSITMLTPNAILAFRDAHGLRPLMLGTLKTPEGNSYIVASETCAATACGGEFIRDINPGEAVAITNNTVISKALFSPQKPEKLCVFEYIYFARPDSNIRGLNVYNIRKKIGARLAEDSPAPGAEVVIPVPDSGIPAAVGFATYAKLPLEFGIIRSHYIGRTFIDPTQESRTSKVKMKHSINKSVVEGKNIILVDDSIVRGTTSKKIINMLKEAGAKSIHMRISSPPTRHPCTYGIDTPDAKELIANKMTNEQLREHLGLDSIIYLSVESLRGVISSNKDAKICEACFTGISPLSD